MTSKHNLWLHSVAVRAWAMLRTGARRLQRHAAKSLRSIAAALVSPALIILVLVLAGSGLGVAGVLTMWGRGPAMLAGCGFAFGLAALIARGGSV